MGKIGKMGIIEKHTSCEDSPDDAQFKAVAAPWEDEGEAPLPDASAAACGPCNGNAIFWTDPYGGRHCGSCEPPPARTLVKSIEVVIQVSGGMAWEENTEKLWNVMWDFWDPQEDEDDGFF
jgi:hypothetical protein